MDAWVETGGSHRLLLANRTLTDPAVEAAVVARTLDTRWTVVVPVTRPDPAEAAFLASEHLHVGTDEASGVVLARLRLRWALDRLTTIGLDVRGEVGDPDPARAAAAVLRRETSIDEVVLALLPGDRSAWRRRRVAQQLEERHRVTVTTVTATGAVGPPRHGRALSRGASGR